MKKTFEFFANTYRTRFSVKAESEEEARRKLAQAPEDFIDGGYNVDLAENDFDLNDVMEPEQ